MVRLTEFDVTMLGHERRVGDANRNGWLRYPADGKRRGTALSTLVGLFTARLTLRRSEQRRADGQGRLIATATGSGARRLA
jgi:hypothetical protein